MSMAATIAQKSGRRVPFDHAAQAQTVGEGRGHKDQQVTSPDKGVACGDHALRAEGRDSNAGDDKAGRDHFWGYGGHARLGDDAR